MKKLTLLLSVLFFASTAAYSLPSFWYSAVAYNTSGQIITFPTLVEVDITINDGTTIFTEQFTGGAAVGADQFGMVSFQVGMGTNSGNLSSVLMKANTFILVKVRPLSTLPWAIVVGAPLITEYYKTHSTLIIGGGTGWSLTGNAGTNPATNFIGTTDGQSLVFRVNNVLAGKLHVSGQNTSYGYNALSSGSLSGPANTAIGYNVLSSNTFGDGNTAIGLNSMSGNTSGSFNVAMGWNTLTSSNGTHNVAIGCAALSNNISGNNNTSVGAHTNVSAGGLSNTTELGFNALATASNQVVLGDANVTSLYSMGAYAATTASAPNMFVNSSGQIMRSTTAVVTTEVDPVYSASSWFTTTNNSANWNTAFGWGNHALAGYLTSFTEVDPVWLAAEPNYGNLGQTETITQDWVNTAFPWADNEVADNLTINGGTITNTTITGGNVTATSLANALTIGTGLSGTAATFNGSAAVTVSLPNVGSPNTYGSATQVPVITTDAQGRVSGVVNTSIAIPQSAVTNLTTDLAAKANLSGATFTGAISATNLSGTNSGDVTLTGQNYLSLSGQQITANAVNLASANVTGTLPVANGGTNITTYTTGDVLYASAANTLSKLPIGTAGQVLKVAGGIPSWGTDNTGAPGSANYGQMYFYNTGTPKTITSTTYTTITNLVANPANAGVTLNATTGEITIGATGVYTVDFSLALTTGSASLIEAAIHVNGTIQTNSIISRDVANSQTGVHYTSATSCILSLTAGDVITLKIKSDAGTISMPNISILVHAL